MIKVKISSRKILELDRSENSTPYGNEGQPDKGQLPLQARAGMEEEIELDESFLSEKKDRCYRLAKQKYDVFPSAYAAGYISKCRKGKVSKKKRKKNENFERTPE